jgi:hypothetical protein
MTATAYLAGPDVFLPNAVAHAARKVEICQRYGLRALPPLNQDVETAARALDVWQAIYDKDIAMMERCDIIIAKPRGRGPRSAATRWLATRSPLRAPGPDRRRLAGHERR